MPGSVARNTSRHSFRRQCRSCSPTRPFNRPGSALPHVRMWRARERCRPARSQPCFDLSKVPDDTSSRKRETSRKVAALLHLIDGAVCKRDHLAKLVSPDGALERCDFPTRHIAFSMRLRPISAVRLRFLALPGNRLASVSYKKKRSAISVDLMRPVPLHAAGRERIMSA